MKQQSKINSLIETVLNIGSGYFIAILVQLILFPKLGLKVEIQENMLIAFVFMVVSMIRTYLWRRFFNWLHFRKQK